MGNVLRSKQTDTGVRIAVRQGVLIVGHITPNNIFAYVRVKAYICINNERPRFLRYGLCIHRQYSEPVRNLVGGIYLPHGHSRCTVGEMLATPLPHNYF